METGRMLYSSIHSYVNYYQKWVWNTCDEWDGEWHRWIDWQYYYYG